MNRAGLALAVLLVAGCAAQPAPTSTLIPTLSDTATPTAIEPPDVAAATPFLDLACSDLVSDDVVQAAIDDAVALVPIARFRELSWFDEPQGAAVRQLGGFTCEWSNGAVEGNDDSNPDYRGIYVSVLPNAADEWPKYSDYYDDAGIAGYCGDGDYAQDCQYDALEGTNWLHVELRGAAAANPAGARDDVVAAVRAALATGASLPPWSPPADSLPAEIDCNAAQPTIDAFFGRANSNDDGGGGGWSQEASSWSLAGILDEYCAYFYESDAYEGSWVGIHSYAGADWALAEILGAGLIGAPIQFTSASMQVGDAGWIVCGADAACVLNVAVAHAWIRVDVTLHESDSEVDTDGLLRALAETLVEQVRG